MRPRAPALRLCHRRQRSRCLPCPLPRPRLFRHLLRRRRPLLWLRHHVNRRLLLPIRQYRNRRPHRRRLRWNSPRRLIRDLPCPWRRRRRRSLRIRQYRKRRPQRSRRPFPRRRGLSRRGDREDRRSRPAPSSPTVTGKRHARTGAASGSATRSPRSAQTGRNRRAPTTSPPAFSATTRTAASSTTRARARTRSSTAAPVTSILRGARRIFSRGGEGC